MCGAGRRDSCLSAVVVVVSAVVRRNGAMPPGFCLCVVCVLYWSDEMSAVSLSIE